MSGYSTFDTWWWPYVFILIVGWLPTDIWRWLGVVAAGRLKEDSEILIWVRAVATALVAGVIARLIVFPVGVLATAPVWVRVGAAAAGFSVGMAVPKSKILLGIMAAEAVLLLGWFAARP